MWHFSVTLSLSHIVQLHPAPLRVAALPLAGLLQLRFNGQRTAEFLDADTTGAKPQNLHGTPAVGVSQTLRHLYSAGQPSRWALACGISRSTLTRVPYSLPSTITTKIKNTLS